MSTMDNVRVLAGAAGTLRPPAVALPFLGVAGAVGIGIGLILVILAASGSQHARYSRGGLALAGGVIAVVGAVLLHLFGGPLFDGGASTR